jgi:protein-tyrosine kinase
MYEPVLGLRERAEPSPLSHEDVPRKTVIDPTVPPASREQYRQLAATLHNAQAASGVKAVMIASAVPGEGKTLTAANLALTFSESYERRVLLVDADLRKPSLHRLFAGEQRHEPGVAGTGSDWAQHVRQLTPRLGILTRKRPSSAPMAELTSARLRDLIRDARDAVDWIVVDTPPIGLLPDATLLAAVVDGAVLVVKAGSTPFELVKRAVEALDAKKTLGVVLNAATRRTTDARYGYDAYYGQIDSIEKDAGPTCQRSYFS